MYPVIKIITSCLKLLTCCIHSWQCYHKKSSTIRS